MDSVHFPLWRYNPAAEGKKLTLDSTDKSDTVSFAANAVSKELGENRFKQLVKKIGRTRRWRCSRERRKASRRTTPSSRSSPRCKRGRAR